MIDEENNGFSKNIQEDDFQNPTSIKHKQKERHLRKKRKKVRKVQTLLRFLLIVAILFLGYKFISLSGWYLPKDAYTSMNSNIVEILNTKIIPDKVVYNAIKDVKVSKLPIFMASVKPLKREIYKIPVVDRVYVRRYGFPARIQIIIKERIPLAVIKPNLQAKPNAFYTSDGVLVTNKNYMNLAQTPESLKIVTKFDKNWTFEKVKEIEEIVRNVEKYSNEEVKYINMYNANDIYIKIPSANIRLGVLDSTVYERIKRIHTILPQIKDMNEKIKYIDLSWDKVNYLKMNK